MRRLTCGLLELRSGYRCDLRQTPTFVKVSSDPKPSCGFSTSIFKGFALIFMSGYKQLVWDIVLPGGQ